MNDETDTTTCDCCNLPLSSSSSSTEENLNVLCKEIQKLDNSINNDIFALLTAESEDEINQLFNRIQKVEKMTGW